LGLLLELAPYRWIKERQIILITGPTEVGMNCLACALGDKA
jgi:hypothetical protein